MQPTISNKKLRFELPLSTERSSALCPTTYEEMKERGWDEVDIVFVSGDAYIDHPSFAMAILGRSLEAAGFRVAMLCQPDWKSVEPWRQFGRPRLFFAISAGNLDSLINHYTANKKVRNDDAYSPGGRIGLRPDRATLPYCHRAREAFSGVPIIAGGVEASLRRLAHYDYWSDTVRKSILLDCKADLLAYGMGEKTIVDIAKRLQAGETVQQLRDMRGIAFTLGAKETPPLGQEHLISERFPVLDELGNKVQVGFELIPSFEKVKQDKLAFVQATRSIHLNTNPFNAKTLVQYHDNQAIVVNPPCYPISTAEMDRLFGFPYTRKIHPSYKESIPAHEMIKDSVTIMRGCFGGCTFCSITAHQGRIIQSRSEESVLLELKKMGKDDSFNGIVSDIGGPTANMYKMRCTRPEVEAKCKRLSCVHPTICKLLGTDHGPIIKLMQKAREIPGIRKVLVASGIRMDLAQLYPEYLEELTAHHVGGHLKVAPEAADENVLRLMKKPSHDNFQHFSDEFKKASKKAGKPKQYLVPYYIASHPGSDLHSMIGLALFLKRNGYKPDQVQDFIPAPFDIATCMYYTGIDPMTGEEVYIAKNIKDRKMQRALLQFFKPENYFEVRKALETAGRADLIGNSCDALISANPPKEALQARIDKANRAMGNNRPDRNNAASNPTEGDHYHSPANNPANKHTKGYRPGRSSAKKRPNS